jgi:hypothetical protein
VTEKKRESPLVGAKKASDLQEDEDVSIIHTLSLDTIRARQAGLEDLSRALRCISEEARDLVDSIDMDPSRLSNELTPEPVIVKEVELMPPHTQESLEKKLVDMSKLIQEMADPVARALSEIHKSRQSRMMMLAVFMLMMLLNMGVSVYVVNENTHLVERIEALQAEFKAHLVNSGLREAQIEQLIKITESHATSSETKAELKKLTEMVEKPSKQALEEAGRAVQQGVPLDKAVRQAASSTRARSN